MSCNHSDWQIWIASIRNFKNLSTDKLRFEDWIVIDVRLRGKREEELEEEKQEAAAKEEEKDEETEEKNI